MQSVVAALRAREGVRPVWTKASDPAAWPRFIEAFAGYGANKFRGEVVAGPQEPAGMGTELAIGRGAKGAPFMRARVAWWDPPRGFTLTASSGGWLSAYHATFTLKLSELNEDLTSLELTMKVVFMNRFVELTSLLLPVAFLYRRRLAKALRLLAG
ncbi:MAG: hypothetical protein HYZ75_19775 [Elusimicrobia bacterium]|nr:hypothetical protein [Elusimicrobiota bacterium]